MIGPILVAVSWILLKFEGKGLSKIGFNAPARRLSEFIVGFIITGTVAAIQQILRSVLADIPWHLNPTADFSLVLEHLRWNTNSVLFEELLFRGYLLYQLIRWLGSRWGVIVNAAAFGVYHWFSYGLFGNPVMMIFIFVYTGAFGLMLALAFAKTKSVAAPIGLHLGWNLVSYLIFSTGPLGKAILIPPDGVSVIEPVDLASSLLDIGLPLLMIAGVWWGLRNYRVEVRLDP